MWITLQSEQKHFMTFSSTLKGKKIVCYFEFLLLYDLLCEVESFKYLGLFVRGLWHGCKT